MEKTISVEALMLGVGLVIYILKELIKIIKPLVSKKTEHKDSKIDRRLDKLAQIMESGHEKIGNSFITLGKGQNKMIEFVRDIDRRTDRDHARMDVVKDSVLALIREESHQSDDIRELKTLIIANAKG